MNLSWAAVFIVVVAAVALASAWRRRHSRRMEERRTNSRRSLEESRRRPGTEGRSSVATDMPDGKQCLEIAGGPLDLMASYDVGHRYWPVAVDDED